ncbi:MAG: B12-binding domain-containing radical SAM protein [Desulfamplus sp.]|nr:B12-binding domain-containing radical SAM protein [Desulfamplus sp.]
MRILFMNHISNGPVFNSAIAALSAFLKKNILSINTFMLNVRAEEIEDVMLGSVNNGNTVNNISPKIENILSEIIKISPDIIAFSIHTPHWEGISSIISAIKKTGSSINAMIVCGGYHPTLCPDEVINHSGVDVICIGEGERPFLDLIQRLENRKNYTDIQGLWIKKRSFFGTKIFKNSLPEPENLDELPYWDRELFAESGISAEQFSLTHIGGFPMASGRGCPYNCNFCNNTSILKMYSANGHKGKHYVRKRSVENVIEECQFLVEKYDAQSFEFWDEMFATDSEWVKTFCEIYTEKINKPFICAIRVERADRMTLHRLHDAGCKCLFMGVEVGNESYRKKYLNRNMSNAVIAKAFEDAKAVGLERFAWVMIGLPDETPQLIEETISFLFEIKPDIIGWSLFHPLPGTYLYNYCIEKGYLKIDKDKLNGILEESFVFPYQNAPTYKVPLLKQPSISKEEVITFCDRFRELEQNGFRVNR